MIFRSMTNAGEQSTGWTIVTDAIQYLDVYEVRG